jgi:hypothetical protein
LFINKLNDKKNRIICTSCCRHLRIGRRERWWKRSGELWARWWWEKWNAKILSNFYQINKFFPPYLQRVFVNDLVEQEHKGQGVISKNHQLSVHDIGLVYNMHNTICVDFYQFSIRNILKFQKHMVPPTYQNCLLLSVPRILTILDYTDMLSNVALETLEVNAKNLLKSVAPSVATIRISLCKSFKLVKCRWTTAGGWWIW